MNHRHSPGGYHSVSTAGALAIALLASCAPVGVPAPPAPEARPGAPWQAERAAVVARINEARAAAGLRPLAYDRLLERVGDLHCATLLREGGQGHFSTSGEPPYLRWLLAGGNGFHRENALMYSRSAPVPPGDLSGVLVRGVDSMLAETPPEDGHRRALLDPDVTHIGVGLAANGGEVRMTHELATEAASSWVAPPAVARPRAALRLEGTLRPPWRPVAAKLLRGPLPRPLSSADASAILSYAYPPPRATLAANRPWSGGTDPAGTPSWSQGRAPFEVDRFGHFSLRWDAGPGPGVEIAVIVATDGVRTEQIAVAASATVVTASGALPPALERWRALATPAATPAGTKP